MPFLLTILLLLTVPLHAAPAAKLDPTWTTPATPFRIADNLFYVGSQDLAAYLITTPAGNILINANLPSSPPQIKASIEKLGFRYADTKILLISQAHYDHAGGAARILRETHAQAMVMQGDEDVIRSGGLTDFLHATTPLPTFPPAPVARVLHDGDTITLGPVTLTAHLTAGHTRGCTTFTFLVHLPPDPPTTLRHVVLVGGYTFWSDFHFTSTPGHPASYPGIADDFRHTFATLKSLPCDIFLAAHAQQFNMQRKLSRLPTKGDKVWIDPEGYKTTIAEAEKTFERRITVRN